jgi:hypothetical protein
MPEREYDELHGTADRLDRDVLAGLGAAQLPHRGERLTVAVDRGGELALGLVRRAGRVRQHLIPSR